MLSLKVLRSLSALKRLNPTTMKLQLQTINSKQISITRRVAKNQKDDPPTEEQEVDRMKDLADLEFRLKKIMSEYVDPVSPFTGLIERWMDKPWLAFFGDKVKTIKVKRKDVKISDIKDASFRVAFDLRGYKPEDIRIIVSESKLYIEAHNEQSISPGSKAWREFSFKTAISREVNRDKMTAFMDSEGLLVIEGEFTSNENSGIKKTEKTIDTIEKNMKND